MKKAMCMVGTPSVGIVVETARCLDGISLPRGNAIQRLVGITPTGLRGVIGKLSFLIINSIPGCRGETRDLRQRVLSNSGRRLLRTCFITFRLVAKHSFFMIYRLTVRLTGLVMGPG